MIIVGKGSDLKKIGFAGIEKCSNCKNYAPFWVCEYSHKLTAYFIPVVRYNRQLLYLCETCNQAFTIKEGMEDGAIKDTVAAPSREDAQAIWNEFDERLVDVVRRNAGQDRATVARLIADTMEKTIDRLKRNYQPVHVDYVHYRFAQYLADDDGPR